MNSFRAFVTVRRPSERSMPTSAAASAASDADLRYPIGRLDRQSVLTAAQRRDAIDAIAAAPAALRAAVRGLSDAQLDTPYRPDGWTVRQLVHHVADSHLNAYVRVKLALTEENPTIKPYDQGSWAQLADSAMPVGGSLDMLDALHARLVHLLRAMPESAFARLLSHPENGPMTIDALLSTYAWHGRHHVAHVTALRERMQWV
jgi:uncharacterized damage-inducible protein DinB